MEIAFRRAVPTEEIFAQDLLPCSILSDSRLPTKSEKSQLVNLKTLQWVPQLFERLEFFHVNKSCKIECCGNKTHQIVQNMTLSQF